MSLAYKTSLDNRRTFLIRACRKAKKEWEARTKSPNWPTSQSFGCTDFLSLRKGDNSIPRGLMSIPVPSSSVLKICGAVTGMRLESARSHQFEPCLRPCWSWRAIRPECFPRPLMILVRWPDSSVSNTTHNQIWNTSVKCKRFEEVKWSPKKFWISTTDDLAKDSRLVCLWLKLGLGHMPTSVQRCNFLSPRLGSDLWCRRLAKAIWLRFNTE